MTMVDGTGTLALLALSALVVALSIVVLSWGQAQEDLSAWAAGLVVFALAFVLLIVRNKFQSPSHLVLVLANVSLSGGFALMLWAVSRFQGRELAKAWYLVPLAVLLASSLIWTQSFRVRAAVVSVVLAVQLLAILVALHDRRYRQAGRGLRLLTYSLSLAAVFSALRSSVVAAGLLPPLEMAAGSIQMLTLFVVLCSTISSSIGFIFMSKERADERNRLMATQDALTGVDNRRAIVGALERDVARAARNRKPLGLLMIDVDHFKAVNDRHGHLAGDQVLMHVASTIQSRIRSQDLLGRYGGEEFLVVVPDTDHEGALQLARKLCDAIAESPCKSAVTAIHVTVSIGVHAAVMQEGDSWDRVIQRADQALYRAKAEGRNRVVGTQQAVAVSA